MIDYLQLSRAISHALRHEPWLYELEVDEEGWVPVDELLAALRSVSKEWALLDEDDLHKMIESSPKKRHEIRGSQIRASYGHSLPGRLAKDSLTPPSKLFHGTSQQNMSSILSGGLKPMSRQYVHLSEDVETAELVGRRKGPDLVVLEIDASAAHMDGLEFYKGGPKVWLTNQVPLKYIAVSDPQ